MSHMNPFPSENKILDSIETLFNEQTDTAASLTESEIKNYGTGYFIAGAATGYLLAAGTFVIYAILRAIGVL